MMVHDGSVLVPWGFMRFHHGFVMVSQWFCEELWGSTMVAWGIVRFCNGSSSGALSGKGLAVCNIYDCKIKRIVHSPIVDFVFRICVLLFASLLCPCFFKYRVSINFTYQNSSKNTKWPHSWLEVGNDLMRLGKMYVKMRESWVRGRKH